jgi:putative two-component system response regulator
MASLNLPTAQSRITAPFGGTERLDLLLAASRILIIDDEKANVRLLTEILRRAGFPSVVGLSDPRQLEARFELLQPDLVLLDLQMPGRDGFEVLAALAPWIIAERLPVCVVTAEDGVDVRRKALALGARDFIAKPFDRTEVVLRVRNLLETRLLHQDLRKQNRALLETVYGRTTELEETRIEMLERLATAAEYRDDSTGQHTARVGALAATLAESLSFGAAHLVLLRRAAALHDVGKIGLPDALLRKSAALSPEEMQVMRTHTTIGAHILGGSQAPLLTMAESIALTHHEHWDGGGYPHHLAGDAIPVEGRIVAVADAFDALTNHRPYREARSVRDALAEIDRYRGSQFDPSVVDALFRVIPHVLQTMPVSATVQ